MTGEHYHILLILLVALILLSGFFSGSETGMMSLNRYRLRHLARKGLPNAKRVSRLLERPDRLLGVILIGNTFANVLASAIATVIAVHFFGDVGVLIATILLTLVILIFAETAPKTLAALYPEKVAYPFSLPLKILLKVFYPLVWVVNGFANALLRLFGIKVDKHKFEPLSLEELRTLVHEATGKIATNYQQMLLRILDLEQITVEDVMIPRNAIYGIDLEDNWDTILERLAKCGHAFVPLYRDNIDHVVGMLNTRKVLSSMQQQALNKKILLSIAEDVYFVPEGAILNRQLLNFQNQRKSIGLVVDEYGDIQGLVTLQDVLEEIVGEFARDIDETTRYVRKQRDGSYLIDGRITIRDLNRATRWNLPLEGPKTLSGLIVENLESIPAAGVSLRIAGYPMEVVRVSGNTVRQVKILPDLYRKPV